MFSLAGALGFEPRMQVPKPVPYRSYAPILIPIAQKIKFI